MTNSCPCSGRLRRAMARDFRRYLYQLDGEGHATLSNVVRALVLYPGIWAVVPYRITHHCLYRIRAKRLGRALAVAPFIAQRFAIILFGIEIDSNAHIGPGLFINHFGCIIIGPAKLGANCNVNQGVTIGRSTLTPGTLQADVPTIGDRVWLGPGAVVAGPITLGSDSAVAANSLVVRDVPDRGVARGVPAEIVSLRGSFRQISYPGMGEDQERLLASMEVDGPGGVR
jgi:serine O-acetyltransferase